MLTVEGCYDTALFSEWFNQVFDSLQFQKYMSYNDLQFFENV